MCSFGERVRLKLGRKIIRIDRCLVEQVLLLNRQGIRTVASCCGHGVFNPTIFAVTKKGPRVFTEILTGRTAIPQKRFRWNFYEWDKQKQQYRPIT